VKPFVENFGNAYSKINKEIDVTVDAGGSGFGISQIANNYCNIGNASKNPFSGVETDFRNQ
jgi:ABC-type phosphate transport system substrate-binding protein